MRKSPDGHKPTGRDCGFGDGRCAAGLAIKGKELSKGVSRCKRRYRVRAPNPRPSILRTKAGEIAYPVDVDQARRAEPGENSSQGSGSAPPARNFASSPCSH